MPTAYNTTGEEYSSLQHFLLEREKIFNRAWQLICGSSELAGQGSYLATNIATIPIFIIRGQDGELRSFTNVCPHRGSPLFKDGSGICTKIVCPYHAAEFDSDGKFDLAGDWFGEPIPPELSSMRLNRISVQEWNGLVFVAIDPFEGLFDQLDDLVPQVGKTPISTYSHFESRQLTVNANWKSYFDQYNEIWHSPQVHPSDKNIGIIDYTAEPMKGLIRMTTGSQTGAEGAYYGGKWMQCWPNWTLVLFEGGMKSVRINPLSPTCFEAFHSFWFEDNSGRTNAMCRKAADATIDIFKQDAALCESVLPSYQSGAYETGPMHPVLEKALIEYQRRIRTAVGRE